MTPGKASSSIRAPASAVRSRRSRSCAYALTSSLDVDRLGTDVRARARTVSRDDVAAADDEPRPALRSGASRSRERVEQEGDAVRRSEGREHGVVQDEERHDPLRPFDGRGERRVVVHAQVAREQNDSIVRSWTKGRHEPVTPNLEHSPARRGRRRRRGRRLGGRRARTAASLRDAVHRRPPARSAALAPPLAPRRHRRPPRERRRGRSRAASDSGSVAGGAGSLAAQLEGAALWPAMAAVDRFHPDRRSGAWPPLLRNGRVFCAGGRGTRDLRRRARRAAARRAPGRQTLGRARRDEHRVDGVDDRRSTPSGRRRSRASCR